MKYIPPHLREGAVAASTPKIQPEKMTQLSEASDAHGTQSFTIKQIVQGFRLIGNHSFNVCDTSEDPEALVCIIIHKRQMPRSATKDLATSGGDVWTRSNKQFLQLDKNRSRKNLPLYSEPLVARKRVLQYLGRYDVRAVTIFPAHAPEVAQFLITRAESTTKRDAEGWQSQFTEWCRVSIVRSPEQAEDPLPALLESLSKKTEHEGAAEEPTANTAADEALADAE